MHHHTHTHINSLLVVDLIIHYQFMKCWWLLLLCIHYGRNLGHATNIELESWGMKTFSSWIHDKSCEGLQNLKLIYTIEPYTYSFFQFIASKHKFQIWNVGREFFVPLKKYHNERKNLKICVYWIFLKKMLLMTTKSCPTSKITLKKISCTTLSTQTINMATHD
jgi:hypothetical protein